jgi:hypothetical protein
MGAPCATDAEKPGTVALPCLIVCLRPTITFRRAILTHFLPRFAARAAAIRAPKSLVLAAGFFAIAFFAIRFT